MSSTAPRRSSARSARADTAASAVEPVNPTETASENDAPNGARRRSSRRESSKSRRSVPAVSATSLADENVAAESSQSGTQLLMNALAIGLLLALLFDVFTMGLRGSSTSFIDFWDMIGTVAYVRGRHGNYALRTRANQNGIAWPLFIVLDSYLLFDVAGKTARTIMRRTPVLPSMGEFVFYVVYGMLPVHFFPGDHLFNVVEKDDVQQLLVCAFWAATKTRSVFNQIDEAVNVHNWGPVPCYLLCLFACEIASLISRVDRNVTIYSLRESIQRVPGGLKTWVSSRTFQSSLFIALFTYVAVRAQNVPGAGQLALVPLYLACFYRYSNGLLEQSVDKFILEPRRAARAAQAIVDGAEEAEVDAGHEQPRRRSKRAAKKADDLYSSAEALAQQPSAKNARRVLKQLEGSIQGAAKTLPDKFAAAPALALETSRDMSSALAVALDRLNRDARLDVDAFSMRLEELGAEADVAAKKLLGKRD